MVTTRAIPALITQPEVRAAHPAMQTRSSQCSRLRSRHRHGAQYRFTLIQNGFTLVELMVVMLIISILLAIAVPSFIASIRSAREAALREDLHTLRDSIEQYTEDKQAAPQSLDDLVTAGYLKTLPLDPMTRRNDTWVTSQSDSYSNVDESATGINDIHSGSDEQGSDGKRYSEW